jgi:PhnB protein
MKSTEEKVRLEPYLYFNGNAKEAIDFYVEVLHANVVYLGYYNECPMKTPDHWKDKVFHATITFGNGAMIMFSDVENPNEPIQVGNNSQLSIYTTNFEQAEVYFKKMQSGGGKVIIPLEKQFWGAFSGSVLDKFGVTWIFSFRPKSPPVVLEGEGASNDKKRKLDENNAKAAGLQVIFLRHAEKPTETDNAGTALGDDYIGLSPLGWERAKRLPGVLRSIMKHKVGSEVSIFAKKEKIDENGIIGSRRPLETVLFLADELTADVNTNYLKGDYSLVRDDTEGILSGKYVNQSVVVCWSHKDLPQLIEAFNIPEPAEGTFSWEEDPKKPTWAYSKIVIFNYDNNGRINTIEVRDQDDQTHVETYSMSSKC